MKPTETKALTPTGPEGAELKVNPFGVAVVYFFTSPAG
ncbi:hypothetical protein SBA2_230015 [Acidobacteriia bacterium SbA2]|nr:hypothetical protein SBA2_230015 [Acidobacteriia bacterium SbA2]